MNRLDVIQNRFDTHFEIELGLAVISLDAPRWAFCDLDPYNSYGWAFPVALNPVDRLHDIHAEALQFWADKRLASWGPEEPLMLLVYSPDVMAESTMQLDDHDLNLYLTAVEYMIDRYVALRVSILDPYERVHQVESDLYELVDPNALALLTRVQMAQMPPVGS